MHRSRDAHRDILRARRQLWVATFAILGALVAVVLLLSRGAQPLLPELPLVPPGALRGSLAALVGGFALYAVDRERQLRRLSDSLTEERVEAARLAEQLRYISELSRERDTNAALLDGSVDGVAVVDRDLRVLRFNAAMGALSGTDPAAALGADVRAVLRLAGPRGEALERAAHPVAAALRVRRPLPPSDLLLRTPDGEQRWVSATFSPISGSPISGSPISGSPISGSPISGSPGREPALVLVLLRDISRQKETEALQRDFVSIVSHELRAPLTAIKGFVKTLLLKRDRMDEEQHHAYLATVNQQADRLARLVEDLLQVSRIDARRLKIERATVDVAEIASGLLEQFAGKWGARDIRLRVEGSTRAWADPRKLEEILINLIDNAVKYSPEWTPVRVGVREGDGEVEAWVEDRGIGIAPRDVANLFTKFHRISTPETRDIGGTGLGLYIVKGLVEAHGGRVWVESVPGAGSTFSFALPATSPASAEREEVPA